MNEICDIIMLIACMTMPFAFFLCAGGICDHAHYFASFEWLKEKSVLY